MNLLDLPTELLEEIFTYAVWIRGVKLALRLTLVNRRFAREVEHAIIASRIFCAQGLPSRGRWKEAYYINRVFTDRLETPLLLHDPFYIIYRCAELICHESGQPGETALRAVIEALCGWVCSQYNLFWPKRGCAPHFSCTFDKKSEDREKFDTHLLVAASYMNCVPLTKQVLSQGYDPTVSSWVFGRSLRAAAIQGNNEILELLLSRDIPGTPYEKKRWAISGATDGGHLDTLDLILEERWGVISPSHKPYSIMHSLKRGLHSPNVAIALRTKELVSTTFPPGYSKLFLDESFCDAVNCGHFERALKYLEMGASIEGVPSTRQPLTRACQDGNYEMVKMILERGGDPNPDVEFRTPLQEAASRGYLGISRILLDHGADVNDVAPRRSNVHPNLFPPPIVLAIRVEHVEMFRLFRQRGAVLDSPGISMSTLKAAISAGLESMVVLLLREGAMVDSSVVGFAIQEGQGSIAYLLRLYKSGLAI